MHTGTVTHNISFNLTHRLHQVAFYQYEICTHASGGKRHTPLIFLVRVQHAQLHSQLTLRICYDGKREFGDGLVVIVGQDVLNKYHRLA